MSDVGHIGDDKRNSRNQGKFIRGSLFGHRNSVPLRKAKGLGRDYLGPAEGSLDEGLVAGACTHKRMHAMGGTIRHRAV